MPRYRITHGPMSNTDFTADDDDDAIAQAVSGKYGEPALTLAEITGHRPIKLPTIGSIASRDVHGRPILTVGQLRSMIAGLDDNTHVVVSATPDLDDYFNINEVGIPNPVDEIWTCVTFFLGSMFDSRQT